MLSAVVGEHCTSSMCPVQAQERLCDLQACVRAGSDPVGFAQAPPGSAKWLLANCSGWPAHHTVLSTSSPSLHSGIPGTLPDPTINTAPQWPWLPQLSKRPPRLVQASSWHFHLGSSSAPLVSYTACWVIDQETCKWVLGWHGGNLSFPRWTLHWNIHAMGGSWALSYRMLFRHPTWKFNSFFFGIGKIPYEYTLAQSLKEPFHELPLLSLHSEPLWRKVSWQVLLLKRSAHGILRECLQDTESKSCVRSPAGRKQKGGKEKDKSKQKTSYTLKWELKGGEIPREGLHSEILAEFQTSDFTAK